jgi:hypothetical protein
MDKNGFDTLTQSLKQFENELSLVTYDMAKPEHICTLSQACNAIELASSICYLRHFKSKSAIPVLLRSLMEVAMRAAYIAKNPSLHTSSLELTANREQLKLLKKSNPSSELIQFLESRNSLLEESGAKQHDFKAILSIVAKQSELDWYNVYCALSNFTHSGLTALSMQHLQKLPQGAQVLLYNEPEQHLINNYLLSANQFLSICVNSTLEVIGNANKKA